MPANIVVPEVGESIVDARVAKWLRKEGDAVSAGDPLVELETDKIDVEVPAPQAGVLSRIDRRDGDDVKVGEVLGVIDEAAAAATAAGGRGDSASAAPAERAAAPADQATADTPAAAAPEPAKVKTDAARPRSTPAARKAAEQHEIDLRIVQGSGEAGRVMRRDVEKAAAPKGLPTTSAANRAGDRSEAERSGASRDQPPPGLRRSAEAFAKAEGRAQRSELGGVPGSPPSREEGERSGASREGRAQRSELGGVPGSPPSREEERVRMSKRRATIAKRLVEAQSTAAMLSTFNEVDMSGVLALRERHKQPFKERHGVGLGIASFFVKASVGALGDFPRINAEIQGDEMVLKRYYDIGVAVGASEGLVVPVLRDADRMSFAEIEKQIRDFARRAEDGTLSLADLKGGTFTITNGGVFGSLLSTPILNPPQVGILGLHKIQERPVAQNGQVLVRPMMYVALTYDHRIVDGAEAVRFLVRIKELVEDPGALLLE